MSVSGISLSGADAGNYTFNTTATTTADITARAVDGDGDGRNKVYDGTTAATVTLVRRPGLAATSFTDSYTSATFDTTRTSAPARRSASAGSRSAARMRATTRSTRPRRRRRTSRRRALTVTATGATRSMTAPRRRRSTLARRPGQRATSFTDSYTSATFADKNVGTGKTVTVTRDLDHAARTRATTRFEHRRRRTTADITARALTVTRHRRRTRSTTARPTATVTLSRRPGHRATSFTDSYTRPTFADKNVGTGKTVTVDGHRRSAAADAGNYTVNTRPRRRPATSPPRALTVTAHGDNKIYDGTTTATATPHDHERVSWPAATRAASRRRRSTPRTSAPPRRSPSRASRSPDGNSGNNYADHLRHDTTADDHARGDHGHGARRDTKIYDGDHGVGGDRRPITSRRARRLATRRAFTRDASTTRTSAPARPLTPSGSVMRRQRRRQLHGHLRHASTTGDHHAAGADGDGDDGHQGLRRHHAATVDPQRSTGSLVTCSRTATRRRVRRHKNVGTGKTVSVTGIVDRRHDAGNYTFNYARHHDGDITARAITVTAAGDTKVYDGTTSARRSRRSTTGVAGDASPAASPRRSTTRTSAPARR